MHHFRPNYPTNHAAQPRLLTTPERVNASREFSGRGVVVAFIDAGFYEHPDIAARIVTQVDCSTNEFREQPTAIPTREGYLWHGQMTSVIACGNGSLSQGRYCGIASEASLVLIKVSSPEYQIKETDILRGFTWLLANHRRYGIRVVNVSVGGDFVHLNADHPLHQAVRGLVEQGVVVVIAAGNKGEHHLLPPASAPEAIVVGGYNDHNTLERHTWQMYHSNYGSAHDLSHKPDVLAPAMWVASPILPTSIIADEARWLGSLIEDHNGTALQQLLQEGYAAVHLSAEQAAHGGETVCHKLEHRLHELKLIHPYYQHVDGTSVATPIVASVVAQMLEANPHLTPSQVMHIIKQSAVHLRGEPPIKQGAGTLHAGWAVEAALAQREPKMMIRHKPLSPETGIGH